MNAAVALQLLTELIRSAAVIAPLITRANAEGRDLTPAELKAIQALDDVARQHLVEAIARAEAAASVSGGQP